MIKRLMAIGLLCISSTAVNAQTASSNFNNGDARFAIDGDPSTRWTSETAQVPFMYFQLDFGSPREFSGFTLNSSGSRVGDEPAEFSVLTSNDGSQFTSVLDAVGDADGTTTVSFPATTARFLRVLQIGSRNVNWWSIHEFTVDGEAGGGTTVQIRQRSSSNHALATNNGGTFGQNVFLFTENGNDVNQQWIETDRGNNLFTYRKNGTNFCLDGGNGGANRQNLYLWGCDSSNGNQLWLKESIGGSTFQLIKSNAQNFAIDGGDNAENRQNVQIFDRNANANQNLQWIIDEI